MIKKHKNKKLKKKNASKQAVVLYRGYNNGESNCCGKVGSSCHDNGQEHCCN